MIGEKKMSKQSIKHVNGSKEDSKSMANSKNKEMVNVKWEKTPTWTIHSYSSNTTDDKKDYKLFTEEGNKGNDDYDTE